jgi:ubiquinone/menaquinone biosynthesis C-methylase UbiE
MTQASRSMQRTMRFWDRVAAGYAARPVADEAAYRKKLEITRRYLTPDARVLEFGCGTGSTALSHAPFVAQIRALDISENMLAYAREKAATAGVTNVVFERGTLEGAGAAAASFDAVLGLSILHLLPEWRRTLTEVHRLLKPGGVFVASTLCLADSHRWLGWIAPLGRRLGLLPPLCAFRKADLLRALEDAGFEIVHQFHPARNKAVFTVARKPVTAA